MANTDDLRYVRTEEAIRAAFVALVSEMPVASVTATEVCRRARISRNAFYLHHSGVAALYAALVDEVVADVSAECAASAGRVISTGAVDGDFSTTMLGALSKHEPLLRALLPADDGSLAKRLAEGLEEAYVNAALLFGEHGGSFEHRLSCSFAAWAHVGVVRCWMSQTDQPLAGLLPRFAELQAGLSGRATRFLAGFGGC